jgi:hypothetical protein
MAFVDYIFPESSEKAAAIQFLRCPVTDNGFQDWKTYPTEADYDGVPMSCWRRTRQARTFGCSPMGR